ncbi:hypothetical protein [Fibrella aquatilis]|uniref:Uncharacterized protein n=1 Tax=Fibrella aquatilis TaxID=2817059 RepID=A0A939GD47_9BACT|nr:hypothetical protein [Fibrella aquatilis]MBO0934491.1 hypothetical protein [Fibrella aquatilis]
MRIVQPSRFNGRFSYLLMGSLLVVSLWLFSTHKHQAAHWRGTFYSFAANLPRQAGQQSQGLLPSAPRFLVDTAQVDAFDSLTPSQQLAFRFGPTTAPLTQYVFMQIGYGYICALARSIFPAAPDGMAVIWLQVLVHLALCGWIVSRLSVGWQGWFFWLTYACNPVIIQFVTYDFYYFWQVIPSFMLVICLLGWRGRAIWGLLWGPLLGLLFVMRPSMLLAESWLALIWLRQRRPVLAGISVTLALLLGAWLYQPVTSVVWRVVYLGIAAYHNPYQDNLSDRAIVNLYEQQTGKAMVNATSDPAVETRLAVITHRAVLHIAQKDPLLFLKNAVCNTLQAFSVGYVVGGGDRLNYALALLGLVVLYLLLRYRQLEYVIGILATVGTFTPYYPPIPAYMYGAYLLLVMSIIPVVGSLIESVKR